MKSFIHHNAKSLREASTLLAKNKVKAKAYAGGTDLLGILKDNILPNYPEKMINLKTIEELDYIKEDKKNISIGALARLSDIANSPVIKKNYRLLAEAAGSVATPNIRNTATIGGNLAQDVRCWYYRYSEQVGGPVMCLRKGGKLCNALAGDNRYHSIFGATQLTEYPCSSNCPAHTDIPSYFEKIKNKDYVAAAELLLLFNPFPAVTGRICPVFCEPQCNRSGFDEPVAIQCVERSIGDYILNNMDKFYLSPKRKTNRKIAIIGAGPAGLAAAYYLRISGFSITIFEKLPNPGGMLYYGIPPYRLPKDIVDKHIQALKKMGIIFKLKINIGKDITLAKLTSDFDTVFLSTGAWKEKPVGIKGEEHIISGLDFLNRMNAGDRKLPGKKVAVIGGGNTAMDVARTLQRMGAEPVVIYRRSRNEMPAHIEELKNAEQEGVQFKFLTQPAALVLKDGIMTLNCSAMKLGPPDSSGRPKAIPVAGSGFTLNFDAVIKAIGEEPDMSILPAAIRKKINRKPSSASLLDKNIFIGGDFASGPSTAIEAIASGRKGALLIEQYLNASKNTFGSDSPVRKEEPDKPEFITPCFKNTPRIENPEVPTAKKTSVDKEDITSINIKSITAEAERCFNCGCLAVSPSDIGTALIALDAKIVTTKRTLDAEIFFTASSENSNMLDPEELITEIRIPAPQAETRQNYIKFTLRKPVDFALVSAASTITVKDGVCTGARIVMGGVAPSPVRAKAAEKFLKGKKINKAEAEKAGGIAVENAIPLNGNSYKVQIAKTLVKRVILGIKE
jgi:NADPH-dependent glutamate synthase beta subunit-like oxidoreductase